MWRFSNWQRDGGGKYVTSSAGRRSPSTHKHLSEQSDWTRLWSHMHNTRWNKTHILQMIIMPACGSSTAGGAAQRHLHPAVSKAGVPQPPLTGHLWVTTAIDATTSSIRSPSKTPPSGANNCRNTTLTMLRACQTISSSSPGATYILLVWSNKFLLHL